MKTICLKLAKMLLGWSGELVANDWGRVYVERDSAEQELRKCRDRELAASRRASRLESTMRLADGLLSQKAPDDAQRVIRNSLIALGTEATNDR
jgi:hypothetical protein